MAEDDQIRFRKVFCKGCCYLGKQGDEFPCFCYLPPNKDCVLEDWKMYAKRAREFVKNEKRHD